MSLDAIFIFHIIQIMLLTEQLIKKCINKVIFSTNVLKQKKICCMTIIVLKLKKNKELRNKKKCNT